MAETKHTGNPSARQALLDLAERCEREAGGMHLDQAILSALGYTWRGMAYWHRDGSTTWKHSSKLTTSLDAAVTLVPEGFAWSAGSDTRGDASVDRWGEVSEQGAAKTAALALCAAALRARAAETE